MVVGLVWSEFGRRRRSHRPATAVPWPADCGEKGRWAERVGEKEEGENERERVDRAHALVRPVGLG
jgi:hypothetical protein